MSAIRTLKSVIENPREYKRIQVSVVEAKRSVCYCKSSTPKRRQARKPKRLKSKSVGRLKALIDPKKAENGLISARVLIQADSLWQEIMLASRSRRHSLLV
jgi:hypothetical protein